MARTLQQLLQDVNAYVALDSSVPTGTDLTTWTTYANKAVLDAASNTQLPQFHQEYFVTTSGGPTGLATLASISLPANFREMESTPQLYLGNGIYSAYTQISPAERFSKQPGDKYCYVLGNPASGFTAVFNQLANLATLSILFQRFPSGMATLTDQCELDDDTFVVEQVKSYILQARSDDRFPTVQATANQLLKNMNGRQSRNPLGGPNKTAHVETYRIGD
jgi:hypothetical protein